MSNRFVYRHGKRIEIHTLPDPPGVMSAKQKRRQAFKVKWVKLPLHWAEALRQSKQVSTYQLAHTILFEEFKRKHLGGDVVLSTTMTGMPRSTRQKAVDELVKLKLIEVEQYGNGATKVIKLLS